MLECGKATGGRIVTVEDHYFEGRGILYCLLHSYLSLLSPLIHFDLVTFLTTLSLFPVQVDLVKLWLVQLPRREG